jgi:hypothetical protein
MALTYLKIITGCRKSKFIASQTLICLHKKIYFQNLFQKKQRLGPIFVELMGRKDIKF